MKRNTQRKDKELGRLKCPRNSIRTKRKPYPLLLIGTDRGELTSDQLEGQDLPTGTRDEPIRQPVRTTIGESDSSKRKIGHQEPGLIKRL